MKAEETKPQISQMNADDFLNAFICANLCHLRLIVTNNELREILGKEEV